LKYLRYTAAVLIFLAISAAVTQFYRESIVRGFANSALRDQGITATELSIQTLGTDYVRLSHLVLEQDDGTRYEVSGLSFPLTFPSVRPERISIEQLVLVPAATETVLPLSQLLNSLLQLPNSVPNTEVSIARFTMPSAPPLDNIVWRSEDQRQQLTFSALSVDVSVEIDRVNDSQHQLAVNAVVGGVPGAFSSTLSIDRIDTGFSIVGKSSTNLSPWLPLLQSVDLLSDDVVSIDARFDSEVRVELYDDESLSVPASGHFSLADPLTSAFSLVDNPDIRLQVDIFDPIRFDFEYPSLHWTAGIGQIGINVKIETVGNVMAQLAELECSSGVKCMTHVSLDTGPIELETLAMGGAKISATLTVTDDEIIHVSVSPDFAIEVTGIKSQSFSMASLSATQISGSQLTIDASGWYGDIDRVELLLTELSDREGMVASLPMTISKLRIMDSGATVNAGVSLLPKASTLSWPGGTIIAPGVRGTVMLQDDEVASSARIFDDGDTLSAQVNVSHDMSTGAGSISIDDASLYFDQGELSGHFSAWPYPWDVISGTFRLELKANWKTGADGTEYNATMTCSADALTGNYGDVVFSGLATKLTGSLDSLTGTTVLPSTITLALLDVGVPMQQIAANFSVNVAQQSVQVDKILMSALGGQLVTDPFLFRIQADRNDIALRAQSIQLQFMADLAEYDDVELSGSISGVLPMAFSENTVTITDGRLESDPPGGAIHYLPGMSSEDDGSPVSDLDLVSRALANFQYDSLTADVNYTDNGDLKLQMRLTGMNPDMDATQPVIFNLGVENNIPQLLRSLQATRSIEDILERQGTN